MTRLPERLSTSPIGRILLAQGALTQAQLDSALELQQSTGRRLGRILVETGVVTGGQLARALTARWKLSTAQQ